MFTSLLLYCFESRNLAYKIEERTETDKEQILCYNGKIAHGLIGGGSSFLSIHVRFNIAKPGHNRTQVVAAHTSLLF